MAAAVKKGESQAVLLARVDERLEHVDTKIEELKIYLKEDHLAEVKLRITKLEERNDVQDAKIEKNTKAMWKVQTIYTTIIVVINLAFMAWRVLG